MTRQNYTEIINSCEQDFQKVNECQLKFSIEASFATQIIAKNEDLMQCTEESIREAIIRVALTGLTLDPLLQQAYLVPRKRKGELQCCLDIGYRGFISVLTDPEIGTCKKVWGEVIKENDDYSVVQAPDQQISHVPAFGEDRGEAIGAYAIAKLKNGELQFVAKPVDFIENVRSQSPSGSSEYSAWNNNWEEMAIKTMIRNLWKYLCRNTTHQRIKNMIKIDNENYGQFDADLQDAGHLATDDQGYAETVEDDIEPFDYPSLKKVVISDAVKAFNKNIYVQDDGLSELYETLHKKYADPEDNNNLEIKKPKGHGKSTKKEVRSAVQLNFDVENDE